MDPNLITYFGETDARNKKIKFGIKPKDRLKHVYVIGKTGMGKSTLLENMAIQDIQNGNGLAFIDPHGGTAEKLLDYVPESRIKDVLYFAPFDMEHPIAFNVMEDVNPDKRHLVVNGLMATFEKIWADAWSARMSYILQYAIIALLEYPDATLLGINKMLSDKEYRKKVVDNITDASAKSFWVDEFAKYTERFAAEATPAIQNKVGQFTSNSLVRNIIGQSKSSFDIRKMMDEKKILIINLSKGQVGELNAKLIGSMLITKIYLAAMSRADLSESEISKLPNFYLYVDEFQSFANKSFADILSEARKYKLNLTVAHQYIEQMEEEVRDAVFGNVGTIITFRVGAFDAEVLEKEFTPTFTATDLVNLGIYQMYLKLMIDGVTSQPFSAKGMVPIQKPDISFKDTVLEHSRKQFSTDRASVEKSITDFYEGDKKLFQSEGYSPKPPYRDQRPFTQNDNRQPSQSFTPPPAPPQVRTEAQKIDENKQAFLRASEVLRQKVNTEKEQRSPASRETISLNSLRPGDEKKNPSKENITSLKDALSSVINSPKKESEIPKHVEHHKPEPKKEIPEVKHQPISNKTESPSQSSKKEVPESVLRDLLRMEDNK